MRCSFTAVLALLATAPSLHAAEPDVLKRWDFRASADADGWTGLHDGKDLQVRNDALSLAITGIDTFIEAPPVRVPLDGVIIRIRLRSDRDGHTQLYWRATDIPQFTESAIAVRETRATPAGEFLTIEFPIGKTADAGKTLTHLRIDPFNGNTQGFVEIQSVEILRLPPILDVHLGFEAAQVDVGEPVNAVAWVRQLDGRAMTEPLELRFSDDHPARQIAAKTRIEPERVRSFAFDQPGVRTVQATLREPDGRIYRLDASVIVGHRERLPIKPALRTSRLALDLIPTQPGGPIGAARWQIADQSGQWRDVGWLLPLCELTLQTGEDITRSHVPLTPDELSERLVTLKANLPVGEAGIWFAPGDKHGLEAIRTKTYVHASCDARLLALTGPVLRVNHDQQESAFAALDRYALFGGIEFLDFGWSSSSDRAVGKRFADRWSPAPHKITMPVMAVQFSGGITSALMWDPEQEWVKGQSMPAATFASPNFIDRQPNALMTLSVPGTPTYRRENCSFAHVPWSLKPGEEIAFSALLHAAPDLSIVLIAKRYYELFPPPPLPPPPHSDRELYNVIARNFGETMYTPGKGWTMHWFFPEEARHIPMMAGELVAHAVETGNPQWVQHTGQTGRGIIESCGSLVGHLGGQAAAQAAINAMRPDGTFAFHNTEHMRRQAREFTKGEYDSLGTDGATSLGTCVQAALPLLRHALLTGEDKYIPSCRKALDAMHFTVPRGAQVWEVHQEIPDIRAAALAVEAFQIGHRLTGDEKYLEAAVYYAWTGVPFVYSWHVRTEDDQPGHLMSSRDRSKPAATSIPLAEAFEQHRRRVTPYATIPVLGPTFYVHGWFGVPVQWCGLEWAWKVLDLLKDRPDPLLQAVADGVIASGFQQTFDKPPWVGLYPDSWDLALNRAQGALLSAHLTLQCLQSQERVPLWTRTWTRVVRSAGILPAASPAGDASAPPDGLRWHISGWGPVPELTPPLARPLRWSVTLRYPRGQLNELLLAHADKPRRVSVEDDALDELRTPPPPGLPEGWSYDAAQRVIVVRFRQPAPVARLRFSW